MQENEGETERERETERRTWRQAGRFRMRHAKVPQGALQQCGGGTDACRSGARRLHPAREAAEIRLARLPRWRLLGRGLACGRVRSLDRGFVCPLLRGLLPGGLSGFGLGLARLFGGLFARVPFSSHASAGQEGVNLISRFPQDGRNTRDTQWKEAEIVRQREESCAKE